MNENTPSITSQSYAPSFINAKLEDNSSPRCSHFNSARANFQKYVCSVLLKFTDSVICSVKLSFIRLNLPSYKSNSSLVNNSGSAVCRTRCNIFTVIGFKFGNRRGNIHRRVSKLTSSTPISRSVSVLPRMTLYVSFPSFKLCISNLIPILLSSYAKLRSSDVNVVLSNARVNSYVKNGWSFSSFKSLSS